MNWRAGPCRRFLAGPLPPRPARTDVRPALAPACAAAAGLKTARAVSGAACASGALILAGSQTLGKTKKGGKSAQRHSAGNIDLDSVDGDSTHLAGAQTSAHAQHSQHAQSGQFRGRSKTVSDAHGEPDLLPGP